MAVKSMPLRVFAMARPRRPASERALIDQAAGEIGATGSRRAIAAAVADRVATMATEQLALCDLELLLAQTSAAFETPALSALAYGEGGAASAMLQAEAVASFERRGCRHASKSEWPAINAQLREALSQRLAERYRRP